MAGREGGVEVEGSAVFSSCRQTQESLVSMCGLIIRDGQAAEDGEAAGGVQRGGLRAAQAAPGAALVALLV